MIPSQEAAVGTTVIGREESELIRVCFAAERTQMAWIRTALALMGFGFIVARFGLFMHELAAAQVLHTTASAGYSLWLGLSLVVLGVLVNLFSARQHYLLLRWLGVSQSQQLPKWSLSLLISLLLALLGILMAIYLLNLGIAEPTPG